MVESIGIDITRQRVYFTSACMLKPEQSRRTARNSGSWMPGYVTQKTASRLVFLFMSVASTAARQKHYLTTHQHAIVLVSLAMLYAFPRARVAGYLYHRP